MSKRVLLVEDDFALNDAFTMILEHAGYTVASAMNGKQALELLEKDTHTPDIILLDILMPVMDGKDFLRAFNNTRQIPVIVLSNLDSKDDVEEMSKLGASEYILKSSITPDVLVSLVKDRILS